MSNKFSKTSEERLNTCHPDLIRLFTAVLKDRDCTILEGHRSRQRQEQLLLDGKTKTLKSNHLHSPSLAVDVMPYPIDWDDRDAQYKFATRVFDKAMRMGIRVRWGGWFKAPGDKIFYDSPHWEII